MARLALTDRFVASPKRIPASGRKDWHDAVVPGLSVRANASGHRSYVLIARYPGSRNPTRRLLGSWRLMTLDQAREKARTWLEMIGRGVDPAAEAGRARATQAFRASTTFRAVADAFLTRHTAGLAHAAQARRLIEHEFVTLWADRQLGEITGAECAAAVRAIVERGAREQARSGYEHLRRLYNWAIGTGEFGITISPLAGLRPADLIGVKYIRSRVLADAELRAVWRAANGPASVDALMAARSRDPDRDREQPLGYPYGPAIRLLILTGQRLNEIAQLTWSEIDLRNRRIAIPAERMKSDRAHIIPLENDAAALLSDLPRFTGGDFVFSTTDGLKPINGFSRAKERLDKLSHVSNWVLHDIRRTVRTHFSALPVQDIVRELVIAHAQKGLHKVYDIYSYESEKRECLRLWEERLREILAAND